MNKRELVEKLANWPDDAQVEVSVLTYYYEDVIWYELTGVEDLPKDPIQRDHCLLFTGSITME